MANDIYDLDALLAAHTRYVWDDDGNDWITVNTIRTLDPAWWGGGNFALRVFLTNTIGQEGFGYAETMQVNPLLYESVIFYGTIENIQGAGGRELYSGNASANTIIGDGLDQAGDTDLIYGLGGNDILIGAGGSDTINGDDGNDSLFGDTDPAAQSQGNVAIGDDTLNGGAGDDLLCGGGGTNYIDGGSGFDRITYQDFQDDGFTTFYADVDLVSGHARLIAVDLYDGTQYVWGFDFVSSIESFTGTMMADVMLGGTAFTLGDQVRTRFDGGAGNDSLTGGLGADILIGGEGDDWLDNGGNGNIDYIADLLQGGAGNDTYILRSAADVVEDWGAGTDTLRSDLSWTLGYNLENLILTEAAGAGFAIGNVLDNRIEGNSAANVLDGRGGLNTLVGGAGNDTYVVHFNINYNLLDAIVEDAAGGIDTVRSDHDVGLFSFDNVENLVLTGTGDFNAWGNVLANRLTGNTGNNQLTGAAGDTLAGGFGNDTYYVLQSGVTLVEAANRGTDTAVVHVHHTLANHVEALIVANAAGLAGTGNAMGNSLTGNTGNDTLNGLDGDDLLLGGRGDDSLLGSTGNDTLRGDAGNDRLNGGDGIDLANYSGTFAIRIDLALTSAQATGLGHDALVQIENVQSGSGADVLRGNALANLLASGGSDDDLFGAGGNDTLRAGAGFDTLRADSGNDVLDGGADDDVLQFAGMTAVTVNLSLAAAQNTGWGMDQLISIENVVAAGGADRLTGNALDNDLNGMAGNDTISAGAGADLIWGGTGNDSLTGGGDGDIFLFGTAEGSDVITDFQNGIDAIVMGVFASVTVQDAGANTLLIYGATQVTLLNVDHTLIDSADFLVP